MPVRRLGRWMFCVVFPDGARAVVDAGCVVDVFVENEAPEGWELRAERARTKEKHNGRRLRSFRTHGRYGDLHHV